MELTGILSEVELKQSSKGCKLIIYFVNELENGKKSNSKNDLRYGLKTYTGDKLPYTNDKFTVHSSVHTYDMDEMVSRQIKVVVTAKRYNFSGNKGVKLCLETIEPITDLSART